MAAGGIWPGGDSDRRYATVTDLAPAPAVLRNALGQIVPTVTDADGIVRAAAPNGRLVVAPGQTIASAWGNTTYDQTMQTFASAADRTNQWPAPTEGAQSWLVDSHTPWVFRGGVWRGIPMGWIASIVGPASMVSVGTTLAPVLSLSAPLIAGRRYRAFCQVASSQQTANGQPMSQLNSGNPANIPAGIVRPYWSGVSGNWLQTAAIVGVGVWVFVAAATATETFTFSAMTSAGTNQTGANSAQIAVEDIGS